ncbi:hypothetical protein SK128_003637 [Halocaridina rubra]|uniref:Uncharacterized protein n=1 Tax=Halocaridina rubra TaxID=373956 RepID=A0AAN8XI62_HALRR
MTPCKQLLFTILWTIILWGSYWYAEGIRYRNNEASLIQRGNDLQQELRQFHLEFEKLQTNFISKVLRKITGYKSSAPESIPQAFPDLDISGNPELELPLAQLRYRKHLFHLRKYIEEANRWNTWAKNIPFGNRYIINTEKMGSFANEAGVLSKAPSVFGINLGTLLIVVFLVNLTQIIICSLFRIYTKYNRKNLTEKTSEFWKDQLFSTLNAKLKTLFTLENSSLLFLVLIICSYFWYDKRHAQNAVKQSLSSRAQLMEQLLNFHEEHVSPVEANMIFKILKKIPVIGATMPCISLPKAVLEIKLSVLEECSIGCTVSILAKRWRKEAGEKKTLNDLNHHDADSDKISNACAKGSEKHTGNETTITAPDDSSSESEDTCSLELSDASCSSDSENHAYKYGDEQDCYDASEHSEEWSCLVSSGQKESNVKKGESIDDDGVSGEFDSSSQSDEVEWDDFSELSDETSSSDYFDHDVSNGGEEDFCDDDEISEKGGALNLDDEKYGYDILESPNEGEDDEIKKESSTPTHGDEEDCDDILNLPEESFCLASSRYGLSNLTKDQLFEDDENSEECDENDQSEEENCHGISDLSNDSLSPDMEVCQKLLDDDEVGAKWDAFSQFQKDDCDDILELPDDTSSLDSSGHKVSTETEDEFCDDDEISEECGALNLDDVKYGYDSLERPDEGEDDEINKESRTHTHGDEEDCDEMLSLSEESFCLDYSKYELSSMTKYQLFEDDENSEECDDYDQSEEENCYGINDFADDSLSPDMEAYKMSESN